MEAQLPNAGLALVEERKVLDYLLNLAHLQGASKARFFFARGFSLAAWESFSHALCEQGRKNQVTKMIRTPWGTRYQVDCHCPTPDGLNPCVRTVWEIGENGIPRLLTAHPLAV